MIRIAGVVLAALALTGCGQVSSTHSSPHSLSPVKNLVLTPRPPTPGTPAAPASPWT
jgi:hypothetical protein